MYYDSDSRLREQEIWLKKCMGSSLLDILPIKSDASFRRYFRVQCKKDQNYIAMDAPPDKESIDSFVEIHHYLKTHGIRVPEILHYDITCGRMLLEDFGDQLLLPLLDKQTASYYYDKAFAIIDLFHQIPTLDRLPLFQQEKITEELYLFEEWFLKIGLNVAVNSSIQQLLQNIKKLLIDNNIQQPQVFVHLDFHSRNLMVLNDETLGVLDFQDARKGPITYDLVSLLKDCYITWSREQVIAWLNNYYVSRSFTFSFEQFLRWFDLTGLQRHLKVVGIFSRLYLRDHKPQYLYDIPRIMEYILEICSLYAEFHELGQFLQSINFNQATINQFLNRKESCESNDFSSWKGSAIKTDH